MQRGLIAELHILRLSQDSDLFDIDMWRGPLREPHDIVDRDFALEVKSLGELSRSIEIHGPEQLAEPGRPFWHWYWSSWSRIHRGSPLPTR